MNPIDTAHARRTLTDERDNAKRQRDRFAESRAAAAQRGDLDAEPGASYWAEVMDMAEQVLEEKEIALATFERQHPTDDPALLTAHLMEALQLAEETLRAEARRLYAPREIGRGMLTRAADLIAAHHMDLATGPEAIAALRSIVCDAGYEGGEAIPELRELRVNRRHLDTARAVIRKAEGR